MVAVYAPPPPAAAPVGVGRFPPIPVAAEGVSAGGGGGGGGSCWCCCLMSVVVVRSGAGELGAGEED